MPKTFQILLYWCAMMLLVPTALVADQQKGVTMTANGKYQNRLVHEKSPYLLQHADNPVDWYPWGEEAFEAAKKEDKPVFLSIGYSTCHWCHVMEHESFEDPEIAKLINETFIPVKVDREERPDLDNIYMSAVMAMTGRGGWPLTAFLTHDKKPFFGGTYFPPKAKWGSPGITDLISSVKDSWVNRREEIMESSDSLTAMLKESAVNDDGNQDLAESTLRLAFSQFQSMYDDQFGGFGNAPKFPSSHNLSFLLRYWKRTENFEALEIVKHTLQSMANGGMYDHLGGGFHRYSTDRQWQIPHFEKMLYDQAILSRTYLEAYQITRNEFYGTVARETFDYVLRDMQFPQGGFYSAEDADSLDPDEYTGSSIDPSQSHEKKEGSFYLWRLEEINGILDERDAKIFNYHYGIKPDGNALNDPHGEFTGKNIAFIDKTIEESARRFDLSIDEIKQSLKMSRKKLFSIRENRPRPHLDDKILVDWNGLMISSLAFGSRVLNEPKYADAAIKAAQFIIKNLITDQGRLLHRYRDQDAAIDGTIEDYAFFINGLLDLYEATFDLKYLKLSIDLAGTMVRLFADEEKGGFYFTADDSEQLLFRQKEIYDGALPSGNSMAAFGLVRLYHLTLSKEWESKLEAQFKAFSGQIARRPSNFAQMLIALDFTIGPSQEIVIAAADGKSNVETMVNSVFNRYIPNRVIMLRPVDGSESDAIVNIAPFVENQLLIKDRTTVYLCENHICKLPVNDVNKLEKLLDGLNKKIKGAQ